MQYWRKYRACRRNVMNNKMMEENLQVLKRFEGFLLSILSTNMEIGLRSRPWTQKVELFFPCITYTERDREIFFLSCQSRIFNLLWCLVVKSTVAPFTVVE